MSRTWFITGCSTGFGRLLTQALLKRGDRVVATARDTSTLDDLERDGTDQILKLRLDVTSMDDITAAVAATMDRFGGIDVLVNNAGYGYFGTQEEGDLAEVRAMYETNVFGLIAVTQAWLPHLRTHGSGTVVNLSSVAGHVATPRGGFYQSSKWAVEALSEALHLETHTFGLRVVLIEPGRYATDFGPRSARRSPMIEDSASPYAPLNAAWTKAAEALYADLQDPTEVVDAILAHVTEGKPFVRVPLGKDATRLIERRDAETDAAFVAWMRSTYTRNT